jgi:hypothetical protein
MGSAQPTGANDDLICVEIPDAQKVDRCLQENSILRDMVAVKDQQIANLEKEVELKAQEIQLKDRVIAIKDMEITATQKALDQMKDLNDRAIKLAETSKPKMPWTSILSVLVAVFTIGVVVAL